MRGFDRPIPAALVIVGEGGGARKLQGAKCYLLVGLGRGGGGRRSLVDGEQRRSAYGIDGEGVLVEDRRRGAVGELCDSEVELMAGSAWAEEVWNGGSTVSSSSPAFVWTVAVFWGLGVGNWQGSEGNGLRGFS